MKDNQATKSCEHRTCSTLSGSMTCSAAGRANGQWTLFVIRRPGTAGCVRGRVSGTLRKVRARGRGAQTIKARDLWALIIQRKWSRAGWHTVKGRMQRQEQSAAPRYDRCSNLHGNRSAVAGRSRRVQSRVALLAPFVSNSGFTTCPSQRRRAARIVSGPRDRRHLLPRRSGAALEPAPPSDRYRRAGAGRRFCDADATHDGPEARAEPWLLFETFTTPPSARRALSAPGGYLRNLRWQPRQPRELQCDTWGVTPSARWDWPSFGAEYRRAVCETASDCADADGLDGSNRWQQRVVRARDEQPLCPPRALR